jgi:hypothetical protein
VWVSDCFSVRATVLAATLFALLWNLISLPAAIFLPEELAKGNWLATIGLLFPLIGIGLAAWAVRAWWRLRRFKTAVLTLPRLPVPLGGKLRGSIRVVAEVLGGGNRSAASHTGSIEVPATKERVARIAASASRGHRT